MADHDDQEDLDLEGEETEEGEESTDDGSTDDAQEGAKPEGDKRIRDLQSQKDKAEARANKAEAALAKALNAGEGAAKEGSKDPERDALLVELRESSLDAVFGEYAELKSYGIDRNLIEGRTRAEMRESATALVALIKSVATRERNRVLKESGITPEPAGSTRTPPKDWGSMSDEDFEKERAKRRGSSLWRG